MQIVEFSEQIHLDQTRYSRYVCDSRAIPNEIDGMKPVQRRILWTMWNTVARNAFTKTVKVAGLVMGYHPHGDVSIQDALSGMVQGFTFSNNYPLVAGEGTFGDVLDPGAIASPRYTEVKLSDFAKDVGFFEGLEDIQYARNYDETEDEPVFFVPKVPVVLLNPIQGIATGFRTSIPGHRLTDVVDAMILALKNKKIPEMVPWYRDYHGKSRLETSESGQKFFYTGFALTQEGDKWFLTGAPQGWNREKTITHLEDLLAGAAEPVLRGYLDHSKETFRIELLPRKGVELERRKLQSLFDRENAEAVVTHVITHEGRLTHLPVEEIVKRFCAFRKIHLVKRFKRLSEAEKEKIARESELIRFIQEKWYEKVTTIKNKADFESKLKNAKYKFFEWLAGIPVYRMTLEEVAKCRHAIAEAEARLARYEDLVKNDRKLVDFMIEEITELKTKWDA